jgi:hypothetical protein
MSQFITDRERLSEVFPQGWRRQPERQACNFREAGCDFLEIQGGGQSDPMADFIQMVIDKVDCVFCVTQARIES